MPYSPRPLDTSSITLPAQLEPLAERLAENVHEVWAAGRMADGWSHGVARDDAKKTHPGLVPYARLPEREKDYDRRTMRETLRAIVALGFSIEKGGEVVAAAAPDARRARAAIEARLADPAADQSSLLAVWRERASHADAWEAGPELYRALAGRLLELGAPLTALEVAGEGRGHWAKDVRLRQLCGLALARTGAIQGGFDVLHALHEEGHRDEETIGLLARIHKDLAREAASGGESAAHLERAYALYAAAYEAHPDSYWVGINAATVATLRGDRDSARRIAGRVMEQCLAAASQCGPPAHQSTTALRRTGSPARAPASGVQGEAPRQHPGSPARERLPDSPQPRFEPASGAGAGDRYWLYATLGEAALNLDDWAAAGEWFAKAAQWSFQRFGDVNATRRQARLLLAALGRDARLVDRVLVLPRVVVFAGHMIDAAEQRTARFPLELVPRVRDALRDKLRALDGFVGFSAASAGSDLLFQEVLQELQGEAHVVLPYDPRAFARDQVEPLPGAWLPRYEQALARAAHVVVTSKEPMNSGIVSFDYADMVLQGLAVSRAQELETELVALAVWDGAQGAGGGTETALGRWTKAGFRIETIDLAALRQGAGIEAGPPSRLSVAGSMRAAARAEGSSRVMCMIFADAVHFSKMSEEQVPRFVEEFLGRTAKLLGRHGDAAVLKNTWGDGLFIVFTNVRDAGVFALELAEMARGTRWEELGLPATLNARIAVHAGPVHRCTDPVLEQVSYTGTHVSRAARIEPITPPGEVYASQAFAALCALERVPDFRCEFVKQAELAKNYGSFPTYVVRRARPVAP